jgi:hypothetical protein
MSTKSLPPEERALRYWLEGTVPGQLLDETSAAVARWRYLSYLLVQRENWYIDDVVTIESRRPTFVKPVTPVPTKTKTSAWFRQMIDLVALQSYLDAVTHRFSAAYDIFEEYFTRYIVEHKLQAYYKLAYPEDSQEDVKSSLPLDQLEAIARAALDEKWLPSDLAFTANGVPFATHMAIPRLAVYQHIQQFTPDIVLKLIDLARKEAS